MRKWIIVIVAMHPAFAAPVAVGDENDLKRRIQQLEQQTQILKKSHESFVESITKTIKEGELAQDSALELEQQIHSKLQASGYADVELRNKSTKGSHPSFRIHHFSLILTKQIDEHWRTFAEVEYEDAPRVAFNSTSQECQGQGECSGKIFLEAMNIDYSPGDSAGVRVGRFFTPAGIWSIEHYPPFVVTQERPLHIGRIFPPLIDGALLHGTLPVSNTFVNYDVYTGNGLGSTASSDNNNEKSLGLRAAVQLSWLNQAELGTSIYTDTINAPDKPETKLVITGFHVKARNGAVLLQAEAANAQYQPQDQSTYRKSGFYAQLGVDVDATTVGYRYDSFEEYIIDKETLVGANQNTLRNTFFVNYRIQKNVVIKLEHHMTNYENSSDDQLTVASVAVYLGD